MMGENTPNVSIRNFPKIPPTSTPTIDLTLYLDWIDPGTGSAELDRDPYEMNDRHRHNSGPLRLWPGDKRVLLLQQLRGRELLVWVLLQAAADESPEFGLTRRPTAPADRSSRWLP